MAPLRSGTWEPLSRRNSVAVERLDPKTLDVRANARRRVGVNAPHRSVVSFSRLKRTPIESLRLRRTRALEVRSHPGNETTARWGAVPSPCGPATYRGVWALRLHLQPPTRTGGHGRHFRPVAERRSETGGTPGPIFRLRRRIRPPLPVAPRLRPAPRGRAPPNPPAHRPSSASCRHGRHFRPVAERRSETGGTPGPGRPLNASRPDRCRDRRGKN